MEKESYFASIHINWKNTDIKYWKTTNIQIICLFLFVLLNWPRYTVHEEILNIFSLNEILKKFLISKNIKCSLIHFWAFKIYTETQGACTGRNSYSTKKSLLLDNWETFQRNTGEPSPEASVRRIIIFFHMYNSHSTITFFERKTSIVAATEYLPKYFCLDIKNIGFDCYILVLFTDKKCVFFNIWNQFQERNFPKQTEKKFIVGYQNSKWIMFNTRK